MKRTPTGQDVRLIWGMLNTGFTVVQQLIISLDIDTTTTSNVKSVVPENIHTLSTDGFLVRTSTLQEIPL